MFRAKWKWCCALIAAFCLAAIWRAYPVKFGLAGNHDDDRLIRLADSDARNYPAGLLDLGMDPSAEIQPVSGNIWVFRDLPDIDQMIPALKSKQSPVELNRNDLSALTEKYGDPLECKSFNFIPQKMTGVKLHFANPKQPTGDIHILSIIPFISWSDAAHRFEAEPMIYKEGITVLVEEKAVDGRPTLEFSALSVGSRIYAVFDRDMPTDIGINKCMSRNQSDVVFARCPADREGLFAFRIQSPEIIILTRQPAPSNSKPLAAPPGGKNTPIDSTSFSTKSPGEENLLVLDIHPGK